MKSKKGKICVRCGSLVGEHPEGCNAWGDYWKRHDFAYITYKEIVVNLSKI